MERVLTVPPNDFETYRAADYIDSPGWAKSFESGPVEIVTAGMRSRLT